MRRLLVPLVLAGLVGLAPVAHASSTGPALTAPGLASSLSCPANLKGKKAVLLVPGTTLDPSEFAWNYERSLPSAGFAVCTIDLPQHALGDIQVAAEHVVYAIRTMAKATGQRISIVGHSQGGMLPRWALKYWPDTRADVDDVVGLAPSNHGTLDAQAICQLTCPPAFWQQATGSAFNKALNAGPETYAGISYTVVYTHTDEVVTPNLNDQGSASLHTGSGDTRNVAVQDVCPLDVSEHLALGTYDPVAYALTIDALTHNGPANPARIPASVCHQLLAPGISAASFPLNEAHLLADVATNTATGPFTSQEPTLKAYAG